LAFTGSGVLKAGANKPEWGLIDGDDVAPESLTGAHIAQGAIGNSELRPGSAQSVIGRSAATSGPVADIVAGSDGQVLRRDGGTVDFGALPTNTVGTTQIVDGAVTNSKLRDSAALSIIGRSANSAGEPADIVAASDHQVLRRSGTAVGFGSVHGSAIVNGTIDVTKLSFTPDTSIVTVGRWTRTTNLSIPDNTWTNLTLTTEIADPMNALNPPSAQIAMPGGVLLLSCLITFEGVTPNVEVRLQSPLSVIPLDDIGPVALFVRWGFSKLIPHDVGLTRTLQIRHQAGASVNLTDADVQLVRFPVPS
jgi:hypothetical protein